MCCGLCEYEHDAGLGAGAGAGAGAVDGDEGRWSTAV